MTNFEEFMDRAKDCYELKEIEKLGLTPDMDQRQMILNYLAMLLKWNKAANLVSQKDEQNLFVRHFCDSIQPLLLFGFKKNAKVLDLGAGGGFPSIPIRIFRSDVTFVLAESNKKKASFLSEVKNVLELENVSVFNANVEKMDVPEEKFDYVISRGLGSMQKFSQLGKPFLSPDGRMYTFKGKNLQQEIEDITSNKDKNGVRISEIAEYDLGTMIYGLNLVSLELV